MRALFAAGHPAGQLPAVLVLWAEANHQAAFKHLAESLNQPSNVRRTLGAIYRTLRARGGAEVRGEPLPDEPDQAEPIEPRTWGQCLTEAEAADPESMTILRPYIDRDEAAMSGIDALDKTYRGIRDESDRAAKQK